MQNPTPDSENTRREELPAQALTAKPPGILPKNTQARVFAVLAAVIVAAIALSGGGSKTKTSAQVSRGVNVIDPSADRIAEYRRRLDEETRKLAAEQAALNEAKQAAASAAPRVKVASQPAGTPASNYETVHPTTKSDRDEPKREIQSEKARRDYDSLFASNVALSYRNHESRSPADTEIARSPLLADSGLYRVPPIAPGTSGATQGAAPVASRPPERTPPAEEPSRADGPLYRLLEGTLLDTILTNRLDGALAGPVNTMLTTDVYSHDRQHLLLPQGSRILGEVKPVASFGQQRLAVVFHRILMPDGYSVSLDRFEGMNQIGETGLRDRVNHHYLEIFGASIAIGAIAGLAQANTQYGFTESPSDLYRQGVASSLSQSSLGILDRFLNILPAFTIREGHRIKIYLAGDLLLPDYARHTIPTSF